MFYVWNVRNWLTEVIDACNERKLSPEDSVFALVLFSSLDDEHVAFFRDHKKQISSYAGENVHIFTPTIYEDVIPDSEWRQLRDDFIRSGIGINSRPSMVLFRLTSRGAGRKLQPRFFSAFRLPDQTPIARLTQEIVDACIRHRHAEQRLIADLSQITHCPNLVVGESHPKIADEVGDTLDAPRVFLSHATADKAFVRRISESLTNSGLHPWLDESELQAADALRPTIEDALKRSDILLLFLSSHTAKSAWVQHEAAFFAGAVGDGRIVPVIIDDAGHDFVSRLPVTQGLLYLDFRDPSGWDENIKKLVNAATKRHAA